MMQEFDRERADSSLMVDHLITQSILICGKDLAYAGLESMIKNTAVQRLILFNPSWFPEIASDLRLIERMVLIVTDGAEFSRSRIDATKYHDRIEGSALKYFKDDPFRVLMQRPERILRMIEDV